MNALDKIRQAEKDAEAMIATETEKAAVALASAKATQKSSLAAQAAELKEERIKALASYTEELAKKATAVAKDGQEEAGNISAMFAAKKNELVAHVKETI
jgi:vacuolar-type H+-ATPase subunit H